MASLTFPRTLPAWSVSLLAIVAVAAAVIDIRSRKVPNWLTLPAMALAVAAHGLTGGMGLDGERLGLVGSLTGLAVGLVPLAVCWLAFGAPGGGDVKLMGALGALGGWEFAVRAMFLGFAAGAVMALIVMIRRRVVRQTLKRMWLTLLMVLGGQAKSAEAVVGGDSPTIPFAAALSVGAIAAAAEAIIRVNLAG